MVVDQRRNGNAGEVLGLTAESFHSVEVQGQLVRRCNGVRIQRISREQPRGPSASLGVCQAPRAEIGEQEALSSAHGGSMDRDQIAALPGRLAQVDKHLADDSATYLVCRRCGREGDAAPRQWGYSKYT
jgi:hypothetical protein